MTFPLSSRRRAEDILVHTKSSYYFQVFSGVAHGFAVRGNPEVPDERGCLFISLRRGRFGGTDGRGLGWAKEESARGIKDWFLRFSA